MISSSTNLRTRLRLTLTSATAVAVFGLAGCSSNDASTMPGMNHGSDSPAAATPSASAKPSISGTPAAGPHNDADIMFASMMIPHHQQAIEMSDMILAKPDIPAKVSELAQQVKAAQGPEIAQMSGWLTGWGQNPSPSMGMDHSGRGGGGGMMSQADMDALDEATGTDAAKLFLTGMIKHHQGAIIMAERQVATGQNPDAVALAKKIITDQEAEIATMNQLLRQL